MTLPKAYDPQSGYAYQILQRDPSVSRRWEHCDYAKTLKEAQYLTMEYALAYPPGWQFKRICLPLKWRR